MPRHHHHVYVVELSRQVLSEARFMKANPDYLGGKPCVYVGMTGQSRARTAGFDRMLAKPFRLEDLDALVQSYAGSRPAGD